MFSVFSDGLSDRLISSVYDERGQWLGGRRLKCQSDMDSWNENLDDKSQGKEIVNKMLFQTNM